MSDEEYGPDYYFFGHRDDNDDPRAEDPEHYQYCRCCSFVLQDAHDGDDICCGCEDEEQEARDLMKPTSCTCGPEHMQLAFELK